MHIQQYQHKDSSCSRGEGESDDTFTRHNIQIHTPSIFLISLKQTIHSGITMCSPVHIFITHTSHSSESNQIQSHESNDRISTATQILQTRLVKCFMKSSSETIHHFTILERAQILIISL